MVNKLPLEGIIVADFSWALAGPFLTKNMGEHGATVIRIESSKRLDTNRRSPPYKDGIPGVNRTAYFSYINNDKYDVTLDLKHPKGTELAKRLVAKADVVVENFTPGTMEKFGLNYDELVKVNPNIIMVSLSMQGQTGPHRNYSGYGYLLCALAGFQLLSGFPDRPPVMSPGPQLCDYIGSYSALVAVSTALEYRRKTGKGQYIDLSEFESAAYLLGPLFLDFQANKHEVKTTGNRHPDAAPHGLFRCKGDDRWCAVAVFTDAEWEAFTKVLNKPELSEPRFATLKRRKENEDELDRLVEDWTVGYSPEQVMATLQGAGVAAGVVANAKDMFEDPQMKWRQHFQPMEHLEIGRHFYEAPGFRLRGTPCQLRRPAPLLGQDNEYIYKEFLGLSEEEYINLLMSGAFT